MLGPSVAPQRAATVSFVTETIEPLEMVRSLARLGFMAGNGNFYAVRLLEAMNTRDSSTGRSRGLLRIGPTKS